MRYVLVTPAKDEEEFIRQTLDSVVQQTKLPERWIVVDDGSSDATADIVREYCAKHPFIELLQREAPAVRSFGSKFRAFMEAYELLRADEFDFVGNLDADVAFAPDYFESLLARFEERPEMGLAGGEILERVGDEYIPQRVGPGSVAGAVQLFRRECFEDIGGYTALKTANDSVAEITVRSKGWQAHTYRELPVRTDRPVGRATHGELRTRFRKGIGNRALGYHPLFQVAMSIYRAGRRPYLLGGLAMLAGYFWAMVRGNKPLLAPDVVCFLRNEQLGRLRLRQRVAPVRSSQGSSRSG